MQCTSFGIAYNGYLTLPDVHKPFNHSKTIDGDEYSRNFKHNIALLACLCAPLLPSISINILNAKTDTSATGYPIHAAYNVTFNSKCSSIKLLSSQEGLCSMNLIN